MPIKTETQKIKLPPGKDRRRKLTPGQREEIRVNAEGLSQYKLADKYGVSRRLIQFIQSPEKHAQNLLAREQRGGWRQYYNKDEHQKAMANTRKHRKQVLEKG